MTAPRPRAAIYARFSSDLQSARSAEDQVRVCRTHADREGWDIVEVYSDLAISGTQNNRPGLNALLAGAEAGAFDIVLAEALDRIARNQADTASIFARLEFAGVKLHTISEQRVTELHVGMLGTMNALFVKELGNKIRRGQRGVVARGRIPGGLCYGYEPAPVLLPDGSVERGHRRVVEDQAAIIRRIFAEYLAGDSPKEICRRLNRAGIPSPRGSEWAPSTINGSRGRANGILHNPAYAGRIVYNRVRMLRDPESRKRVSRPNADADRVETIAEDLRIVDEPSWIAVQERREASAHLPFHRQKRDKHLLSGIVRCGDCSGAYTIVTKDRWGCRRHRDTGTCDNGRRIGTRALEARVVGGLQQKLLAPDVVKTVVKRYHESRAAKRSLMAQGLRKAEKRVDEIKAEIANLVTAIAQGNAFEEIKEAITARRELLAIAEAQLAEHTALPTIVLHPQIVEAYRRRIALIGSAITKGESARKFLPVIRGLIETVVIRDDPNAPDRASVEVTGSLAAVLNLTTGSRVVPPSPRTFRVVAEEGLEPPTPGL
ncbi:recombinase family protein [soil metagenome]